MLSLIHILLAGRMGEAIETTSRLYPGLLEHNRNLLFLLKCRQFVEMVNGSDSEVRSTSRPYFSSPTTCTSNTHTSVIQSTKSFNGNNRYSKQEFHAQIGVI